MKPTAVMVLFGELKNAIVAVHWMITLVNLVGRVTIA